LPAQITALPTPPSTNDPANFNTRADAFLGQMPAFVAQTNALASEVYANTVQVAADRVQTGADRTAAAASAASALGAPGTNGSSTTSLTIGTGTKSFTAQTGKAWTAGQGFFLASSASPLNWMTGILTAYNSGTGAATVEVDTIGGPGTFAAWSCGLSAGRPIPVATQAQAEAGTDTTTWMTPQRTAQAAVAFGVPVGGVMQFAGNPGPRWLPCTGLLYSIASYPALAPLMQSYTNPMTVRLAGQANKMVYGAGIFLVWAKVGAGSFGPYTSVDGVNWTQRTNPLPSNTNPNKLIFADGIFIAVGNTAMYTSIDGITWTTRTHPFGGSPGSVYGLAKSTTLWMAVGWKNDLPAIATSPDGMTWTPKTPMEPEVFLSAIAYSPTLTRWMVCTNNSTAWISDNNGTSWSVRSSPGFYPDDAFWAGNKFIIFGGSSAYYSATGDTFSSTNLGSNPQSFFYDGAQYLAGGYNGTLWRSNDGISWSNFATISGSPYILGVARTGNSATTPYVASTDASGVYSGLDLSTTQFPVPNIAGSPSGFAAYIKGI
jgi:hypothetical protein